MFALKLKCLHGVVFADLLSPLAAKADIIRTSQYQGLIHSALCYRSPDLR